MDNEQGQTPATGTRDVTYDLTAVLYHALQGVENCQIYAGDAGGKADHRRFFQMAADNQKKLAEEAKRLLHDCLMQETGGTGQQGMSQGATSNQGSMTGDTHSFAEARDDGSALRVASGQTDGGSDQFASGSNERGMSDGGSAPRRDEMTTGGGRPSGF